MIFKVEGGPNISDSFIIIIWDLRPVKIVSLILSRVNCKMGRKRETSEKKHLTTRKQNLACLTYDLSWARNHSGDMTIGLER